MTKVLGNSVFLFNFLIGIFLLTFGQSLFAGAFHNIDTAQNMRYLEAEYNMTMLDRATDFNIYDADELYIIGARQLLISNYILSIAAFFLGMSYSHYARLLR